VKSEKGKKGEKRCSFQYHCCEKRGGKCAFSDYPVAWEEKLVEWGGEGGEESFNSPLIIQWEGGGVENRSAQFLTGIGKAGFKKGGPAMILNEHLERGRGREEKTKDEISTFRVFLSYSKTH